MLDWMGQQLFPFMMVIRAHRLLRRQESVLKNTDFEVEDASVSSARLQKEVQSQFEDDLGRRRAVESKAQAGLFVVALSITFLLGSMDFMARNSAIVPSWSAALLIAGVMYLVIAAVMCLLALQTTPIQNVTAFWVEGTKIVLADSSPEYAVPLLYRALRLNQLAVTAKCNLNDAMLVCIRNGVALLAAFLMIVMLSSRSARDVSQHRDLTPKQPASLFRYEPASESYPVTPLRRGEAGRVVR